MSNAGSLRYPQGDISRDESVGWADIYFATYRPEQRWYYFPAMRNNELLLLLQCVFNSNFECHCYACTPTVTHLGLFCLLSRYDSRPEVPRRELTDLERAEDGRGFIPPLHSAVEIPGTQGARKRLSLDFRMVCLLPLQPPKADTIAKTCTQSAKGKRNHTPKL
eukprot:COSAG02_NODE_598_length_19747_cov_1002.653400_4_plen_164_part_00